MTLADPDQVRHSRRMGAARLFWRRHSDLRHGKHVAVVVVSEGDNSRHWVLTAYIARRLGGGEIEWARNAWQFKLSHNPGMVTVAGDCRLWEMATMPAKPLNIRLKRAYEPASPEDGIRVLVDRLWPRGLKKSEAAIDHWLKEVAPSNELRWWFGHDRRKWEEFRRKYAAELSARGELLSELRKAAQEGPLTLVYSARDEVHNQAVVLGDVLRGAPPDE